MILLSPVGLAPDPDLRLAPNPARNLPRLPHPPPPDAKRRVLLLPLAAKRKMKLSEASTATAPDDVELGRGFSNRSSFRLLCSIPRYSFPLTNLFASRRMWYHCVVVFIQLFLFFSPFSKSIFSFQNELW